ncbi:MAG: hypothetical protein ONB44_16050 [candidate division KSB1 bacterium]|nr:hypothetical protein [candidate division KSB1 bacterium]MDZ7303646.1 hypothetical protein [candidate division KSB1 bacterium]MDZ7313334.1 hypothetical protein [candidate division KSB1 bacterium]
MQIRLSISAAFLLLTTAIAALGLTGEPQNNSKAPSLVGTYKLIMRQLPDGTKQTAPEVMGLLTYTKTHRNFNVVWKDANGKFFSYSVVSTYKLSATEYSETVIFSALNDQISGQPIKYDLTGASQTVPVTINGSRIEFKMPFDPVTIVFDENWVTGKAEGGFTDYWERVE